MVTSGQLWEHKSMEWLKVRVLEVSEQLANRPARMVELKVENENDTSIHGVVIEFDDLYVLDNYNLIEDSVPTWEV